MSIPDPSLRKYLGSLDARLEKDGPAEVIRVLGRHAQAFPENDELTAKQRAALVEILDAIRRAGRAHGGSDEALVVELMVLGKLGRFKEAVRRARSAFEKGPTWATAIAAGNALRRAGDLAGAAAMFAAAADLDKEDVTALLEVGDIELEAGRTAEALAAYESALKREKGQAWAEPSAWYCRYVLTGERKWLGKLRKAATEVDDCGVGDMLAAMFGGYSSERRRARAGYLLEKVKGS